MQGEDSRGKGAVYVVCGAGWGLRCHALQLVDGRDTQGTQARGRGLTHRRSEPESTFYSFCFCCCCRNSPWRLAFMGCSGRAYALESVSRTKQ